MRIGTQVNMLNMRDKTTYIDKKLFYVQFWRGMLYRQTLYVVL